MRYVMANRRAGKFSPPEKISARAALASALGSLGTAKILADLSPEDPTARRVVVFDAEPSELAAKVASFSPDAVVEPEVLFYPTANWSTHTRPRETLKNPVAEAGIG